jgi:hypothetical protein
MPATVIVSSLTVVHKDSGGMSMIFPDVCKTPSPAGPIPMPYPNVAKSQATDAGSSSVKMDGNPIMLKSSSFMISTGDEAGSAMGVVSNKIKGKAYPKLYSFDVKVEGDNVFRLTDIMLQNGGSPTNTTEVQSPGAANPAGPGKDPEVPQVTKLAWAKQDGCCGDEIELDVETKNFTGGAKLPINVVRKPSKDAETTNPDRLDRFKIPISGDKASAKWIARRGKFQKEVKVTAEQLFYKGTRESNELTLKTAPDAKELITNTVATPKYVKRRVSGVETWVPDKAPSGAIINYSWQSCYEVDIKDGIFTVIRKIDFQLIGGAVLTEKKKKRWKKEIERVWDKQFKVHRTNCKRGDTCDCYAEQGCCSFAIRILCEWGPGQGQQVELHAGANKPDGWGKPGVWWYSHTWWEERGHVPTTVRAHEFGHQIGMYDEYPEGACDPARQFTNCQSSVMNGGSFVFERHFKAFHDWFKGKAGSVLGDTKLLRM